MKKLFTILLAVSFLYSCQKDEGPNPLDEQLSTALTEVSNGIGENAFLLPNENDLAAIPQDPLNPLTPEKVELGKMLFHETGIALAPMRDLSLIHISEPTRPY